MAKENVKLLAPRVETSRLTLDYKRINENYLHLQKKIESMVDLVYSNDCRFRYILKYFGEDVTNYKCGKCDKCSSDEGLTDSTSEYLKELMLRAISEIHEPVNEQVLINILLGTEKSLKYQKLQAFGSCATYSKKDLKTIFHTLTESGTVKKTPGKKTELNISKELIQKLKFEKDDENIENNFADYEKKLGLFNRLREVRTRASKRFLQTGNIICPDTIMREIAIQKPSSEKDLLKIKGFTQRMFNKIGKEFLEVLNAETEIQNNNKPAEGIPSNIKETFNLLKKGYGLKDIASLRKLSEAVISMQIESIIEYEPSVNIAHLFEKDQLEIINSELKKGFDDLKGLKKRLPEEITYPLIRIAVAKNKFTSPSVSSTVQGR